MHCDACNITLSNDDNYCRGCGAPVRMVALTPMVESRPVPATVPAGVLALRVARPLATGAAIVATGALVRFAARLALQTMAGGAARAALRASGNNLAGQSANLHDGKPLQVTEVFSYRRIVRP